MKHLIKNKLNRRVLTIPVGGSIIEDVELKALKGDGKKISNSQAFFNEQVKTGNIEISEHKEKVKKTKKEGDK